MKDLIIKKFEIPNYDFILYKNVRFRFYDWWEEGISYSWWWDIGFLTVIRKSNTV